MQRRRFLLATLLGPLAPPPTAAAPHPPAGWANVRHFGARGDGVHDDSAAFQQAIDRASRVWIPPGQYLVGELDLWSHTHLKGAGRSSALVHRPGSTVLAWAQRGGSPDPRDNVHDIALEDLALLGRCEKEGFSEHKHLLVASACSRLAVRRCLFRGFQGDGVFISSGYGPSVERHNEDIAIERCTFDGVNYENRNCVSIVDGTRVRVERNVFMNCSRHDMPGAIDVEPEEHMNRARDIRIAGNRFVDVQGAIGAICVILMVERYDQPPRGIEIRGNRVEGRYRSPGIVAKAFVDARHSPPIDLVIAGNEILDTFHGFEVSGLRGVRIADNTFRGTVVYAFLSVPHRGRAADITISGNLFEKVGMHAPAGLKVYPTWNLVIERNRFVDCGWVNQPERHAVDISEQPPEELRMQANTVVELLRP